MVDKQKNEFIERYKYPVLVGVGSFVLALILIFVIGKPIWNDLQKTSATLKEKRAVKEKLAAKLENLKTLKDKEAELKEKNQKVMAALPTDKDVSRLFVQFENVASQNGLDIKSVSESTATSATGASASGIVRSVTYTLSGTANNYGSLKQSLAKLEEALRILGVVKIDVNGTTSNLTVTLNVSTYVRSE